MHATMTHNVQLTHSQSWVYKTMFFFKYSIPLARRSAAVFCAQLLAGGCCRRAGLLAVEARLCCQVAGLLQCEHVLAPGQKQTSGVQQATQVAHSRLRSTYYSTHTLLPMTSFMYDSQLQEPTSSFTAEVSRTS